MNKLGAPMANRLNQSDTYLPNQSTNQAKRRYRSISSWFLLIGLVLVGIILLGGSVWPTTDTRLAREDDPIAGGLTIFEPGYKAPSDEVQSQAKLGQDSEETVLLKDWVYTRRGSRTSPGR